MLSGVAGMIVWQLLIYSMLDNSSSGRKVSAHTSIAAVAGKWEYPSPTTDGTSLAASESPVLDPKDLVPDTAHSANTNTAQNGAQDHASESESRISETTDTQHDQSEQNAAESQPELQTPAREEDTAAPASASNDLDQMASSSTAISNPDNSQEAGRESDDVPAVSDGATSQRWPSYLFCSFHDVEAS